MLNADTGEVVGSTTTDACGSYRFDVSTGLELGRYQVRVVSTDGLVREPVISSGLVLDRGDTFLTRVNLGIASTR